MLNAGWPDSAWPMCPGLGGATHRQESLEASARGLVSSVFAPPSLLSEPAPSHPRLRLSGRSAALPELASQARSEKVSSQCVDCVADFRRARGSRPLLRGGVRALIQQRSQQNQGLLVEAEGIENPYLGESPVRKGRFSVAFSGGSIPQNTGIYRLVVPQGQLYSSASRRRLSDLVLRL
jgi:hypothetical protein